jgi:hypothetical protein
MHFGEPRGGVRHSRVFDCRRERAAEGAGPDPPPPACGLRPAACTVNRAACTVSATPDWCCIAMARARKHRPRAGQCTRRQELPTLVDNSGLVLRPHGPGPETQASRRPVHQEAGVADTRRQLRTGAAPPLSWPGDTGSAPIGAARGRSCPHRAGTLGVGQSRSGVGCRWAQGRCGWTRTPTAGSAGRMTTGPRRQLRTGAAPPTPEPGNTGPAPTGAAGGRSCRPRTGSEVGRAGREAVRGGLG